MDTVDLSMLRKEIKKASMRVCAALFACKRLPQGMPVTSEDAQCLARETQHFLNTLFAEIEDHGNQEESQQISRRSRRPQKARPSARE